jgi:phosphoribosylglycinamide formyltransferase-1
VIAVNETKNPSVVILISGTGSNMARLVEASQSGELHGDIKAVISNKPDAAGLAYAQRAQIPTEVVSHKEHETRDLFEKHLMRAIDEYQPDLVVLAGFMRVLGNGFVRHYMGKMLNIHPSLLPKYQGLHTHQRALNAGDSEHGCTIHFVTEELDGGPAIMQASVPIEAADTAESLQKKVQAREHIIYPIAVKWFLEGRLSMDSFGKTALDGKPLPSHGIRLD